MNDINNETTVNPTIDVSEDVEKVSFQDLTPRQLLTYQKIKAFELAAQRFAGQFHKTMDRKEVLSNRLDKLKILAREADIPADIFDPTDLDISDYLA